MSSKFGGALEAAVKLCAMFSVLLFALIGRLESGTWMQLDIYAHPWPNWRICFGMPVFILRTCVQAACHPVSSEGTHKGAQY